MTKTVDSELVRHLSSLETAELLAMRGRIEQRIKQTEVELSLIAEALAKKDPPEKPA